MIGGEVRHCPEWINIHNEYKRIIEKLKSEVKQEQKIKRANEEYVQIDNSKLERVYVPSNETINITYNEDIDRRRKDLLKVKDLTFVKLFHEQLLLKEEEILLKGN